MFGTDFENLETKDRILAVAMDMFFTKEYGKVTLKEIADASGVTKGGIYHYFESKDHLLAEGIKFTFQMIMSEMDSLLEKNISAKEVIASWFNIEKNDGCICWCIDRRRSNRKPLAVYVSHVDVCEEVT